MGARGQAVSAKKRYRGAKVRLKPAPARRGWSALIRILCLIYAAFVLVEDVGDALSYFNIPPLGSLGAEIDRPRGRDGFLDVVGVEPGGPFARAGVVVGDRVRLDRRYDYIRHLRPSEAVGLTLDHRGRTRHVQVEAVPASPDVASADGLSLFLSSLACSIAAVIGAFILWRSRADAATLMLGMALLTYGLNTTQPSPWLSAPAVYPFASQAGWTNHAAVGVLFYAFAVSFYAQRVGRIRGLEWAAFWIFALVEMASRQLFGAALDAAQAYPGGEAGRVSHSGIALIGFAACVNYLRLGWRRSDPRLKQRYTLMLIATSMIGLSQAMDALIPPSLSAQIETLRNTTDAFLTGVVASSLLAYAILRHRVFDLGFVFNRTLVYGAVSAVLLTAFGVIEWGVDHLLKIEDREKNALVDAAIALGVFLTFHRVRDGVEHWVEHLFFHSWQKAEAALRRFVREAALTSEGPQLVHDFARAVHTFAEGAPIAIYLPDGRAYARAAGALDAFGSALNADDPAVARLRTDLRPIEAHDQETTWALIAPMVNRTEVSGLVVLAPKPSGLGYRPDEVELVGWAAVQIGLDLHALKLEQLETERADLNSANAALRSEIAALRSILPQRI